jgi:RimJ/RimL family protein N-acetyltransferase
MGLATEALKQVINYCRNELKLAYIFCNIYKNNKASIRLFENCGFEFVEQRLLNQQKVNYFELKMW